MRRFLAVLIVILMVLAVAGFGVYRYGVHPSIVAWILDQTWERTSDLDARVEGDLELLGIPMKVSGNLRYKAPDLVDVDVVSLRAIATREELWVIVPAISTAFRVHSDRMTPREILTEMLGGKDPGRAISSSVDKPERLTLKAPVQQAGETCWLLEWPGRTGEHDGGRLYVSQRTRVPVLFEQLDSAGTVLRTYKVSDFHRNRGITVQDFSYSPAPGFSVVNYDYDPADPEKLRELLGGGAEELRKLGRKVKEYLPPEASDWLQRHGIQ